jgi:hypothetical protein
MAQTWHDLLFAHWPIAPAALRGHIPAGLQLDTFEGQAWVGVVPFRMSHIHFQGLPPVWGLSAFPELNVRTYVVHEDKPGVWFYSLDAGNAVAVAAARWWFHLPYFRARMSWDGAAYTSRRTHRNAPPAELRARYHPTGDLLRAAPGTLEHWLTERYCLYAADRHGRLYRGDIHHLPWPLQPAEAEFHINTMTAPHDITLPDTAPLLHFARRLEVVVWTLKRLGH